MSQSTTNTDTHLTISSSPPEESKTTSTTTTQSLSKSDTNSSYPLLKPLTLKKKALITGVTGQDGAYLTRYLLNLGYQVYGGYRRRSTENFSRLEEIGVRFHPNFELVDFDITDQSAAIKALKKCQPNELYNLAAQSFVPLSFTHPSTTTDHTGVSVLKILEAIQLVDKSVRFYQASTSEMFGKVQEVPQTEKTPFYPRSPYSVSKLYGHWMTINYRESYDMYACCGILFNHESPLRGEEFVTRKITKAVAMIKAKKQDHLILGNLDAKRDWGFAGDYVEAMHMMLNQDKPDDYVIGTNRTETVRFFVEKAFERVGIELEWHGEHENEYAIDKATKHKVVKVHPAYYRPAEVDLLIGDASKAKKVLKWEPRVNLEELINMMVDADLKKFASDKV